MQDLELVKKALTGKRILVTGGTGFIGGRLIERLATECQVSIRVLVQNLSRACRVARFPVEIVRGDITDGLAAARASAGCDVVFHCAYGNAGSAQRQREVNVQGTKNILDAAAANRVGRVIHLSTILVYGETADGEIDERAPRRYLGLVYPDSKLDAEKLALGYAETKKLPLTVLQPAEVYGPYASVWTQNLLNSLKSTRQILIDGGDGFCSPVYVDDLVSAMMLCAVKPQAIGETFMIAAACPVTWKEFYGRFESMLGCKATVSMTAAEAGAYYEQSILKNRPSSIFREGLRMILDEPIVRQRLLRTREAAMLRRAARLILPAAARQSLRTAFDGRMAAPASECGEEERPVEPLDPLSIRMGRTKTIFRIDKARRLLGYEPRFSLEAGMALTMRWAQWSNLLGDDSVRGTFSPGWGYFLDRPGIPDLAQHSAATATFNGPEQDRQGHFTPFAS
jgi:nucleoside-diphosphate-sugar epimerase